MSARIFNRVRKPGLASDLCITSSNAPAGASPVGLTVFVEIGYIPCVIGLETESAEPRLTDVIERMNQSAVAMCIQPAPC
jgi:hypothetical protein